MAPRASSKKGYNLGSLKMCSGMGSPTLGGLMKLVYSGGDEKMTSIFRKYLYNVVVINIEKKKVWDSYHDVVSVVC